MNDISIENLWIVIPTYNRSGDLLECIASLNLAGISDNKIIVVDNHSQDDTVVSLQKSHPGIKLIALDKNFGATGASNIGFDYALQNQAEFILRLDSDTVVDPDFVRPLIVEAVNDEKIGILSPKIYYYDRPDVIWYAGAYANPWHLGVSRDHRNEKDSSQNTQVQEVDYVWGAALLIKSEVLKKTSGFDTDFFVYHEELDFCRRVRDLGYKLIFTPHSKIWHKVGSNLNNDWTAYQWNRSKMIFYKKHAKHGVHFLFLIIYALLYALIDAFLSFTSLRKKSGNRGPLKSAIRGLWDGFKFQLGKQGSSF